MVEARTLPVMTVIKTGLAALLVAVSCIANTLVVGNAQADQYGLRFENASTYLDGGMYYLDAVASVEIGAEPEEALLNGVDLLSLIHI